MFQICNPGRFGLCRIQMSMEQFQIQRSCHHIYFVNTQHQNTPNVQFFFFRAWRQTDDVPAGLSQTDTCGYWAHDKKSNYLEFKLTLWEKQTADERLNNHREKISLVVCDLVEDFWDVRSAQIRGQSRVLCVSYNVKLLLSVWAHPKGAFVSFIGHNVNGKGVTPPLIPPSTAE